MAYVQTVVWEYGHVYLLVPMPIGPFISLKSSVQSNSENGIRRSAFLVVQLLVPEAFGFTSVVH